MTLRIVLVAGLSPTVNWVANAGGLVRSIGEAVEIAQRWGVVVPDDVAFFLDEEGELDNTTTARGPRVTKTAGGSVAWSDFVHDLTGQVPFIIRRDIMGSDEAIVAVFTHELFELESLRRLLADGRTITIEDAIAHCAPDNPGNLHDEAWAAADAAVRRMRMVSQ
jgi:hypothetical protein